MNPDILVLDNNSRVQETKKQVNNFLNLLQKSIAGNQGDSSNILIEVESQYSNSQSIQQSNKLSVILSASEGASSEQQGKKDNIYDQISMNEFGSSSLEDNFIKPLLRKKTQQLLQDCTLSTTGKIQMQKSMMNKTDKGETFMQQWGKGLNKKNQQQMIDYFNSIIRDYINYIEVLEKRNNQNLLKKEKYRTKCQHLFRAFVSGRQQQKRLLEQYIEQKQRIQRMEQLRAQTELIHLKTSKQLELSRSQNIYLKELIFIANKNYESLENKYIQSQERFKYSQIAMKQKQIHLIEGNSVLKDVIVNLQKQRKSLSKQKSKDGDRKPSKDNKQNRQNKSNKQNKQNSKSVSKHKSSKSVPPQQKVISQQCGKKQEIDDAYRRMFMKTLRGGN